MEIQRDLSFGDVEMIQYPQQGSLQIILEDVELKGAADSEEYRQNELLANHTCEAFGGKRVALVMAGGFMALGCGVGLFTGGIITAIKTRSVGIGFLAAGGGLVAAFGLGSVVDALRLKQIPQVISTRKLCFAALEILLAGGCLVPFFLP